MGRVNADSEAQAVGPGGLGPAADKVFFGTDIDRVPGLVFAVEVVEVVVMIGQRHEILGPCPFVKGHQFVRIPVLGLPQVDDVFKSDL